MSLFLVLTQKDENSPIFYMRRKLRLYNIYIQIVGQD